MILKISDKLDVEFWHWEEAGGFSFPTLNAHEKLITNFQNHHLIGHHEEPQ